MKLVKDIDLSPFMEDDSHQKIRPASAYHDEVMADLEADDAAAVAPAMLPFDSLRTRFALRPGELTAWAGINGTGKTWLLHQVQTACMRQGQPVLLASFELTPRDSIRRFLRQAARSQDPSREFRQRWLRWTDGRLWILDHQGAFSATKMLALLRWGAANLPVKHVVIDSLMKLELAPDDYAGQKSLINRMHSLAMETGRHIHLVAHARKAERETDRVDKFSVKGASEIVDQVDNLVLINRNIGKERQIEEWQRQRRDFDHPTDDMLETLGEWDAGLRVAKQRHGEWEGAIPLWLDRRAMAFSERQDAIAPGIPTSELVPLDLEAIAEREAIQAEGAAQ